MTHRILHVISGLGTGGAENALLRLAIKTPRHRYETLVLSLRSGGAMVERFRNEGIAVIELGLGSWASPVGLFRAVRVVRRFAPQVIHGWMNHGNLVALFLRQLLARNARLIWGIRQSIYDINLEKSLTQMVIRGEVRWSHLPDAVLFNSHLAMRQHLALGFRNRWLKVIPNGFDVSVFRPSESVRSQVRLDLGVPESSHVVAIVARFHPMKDHKTFLRAAAIVRQSHPGIYLLLVGRDLDNPRNGIKRCAVELGLQDRCLYMGEMRDLQKIFPAADVVCLSSAWGEGLPNVLGEAMACGVPCVSTDVGDADRLIGDPARIVPVGDHVTLGRVISRLLSQTDQHRRSLGLADRERIKTMYSVESMSERHLELYDRLLQITCGSPP